MYHSSNPLVPEFTWQDSVERGDVVLFAFPIKEDAEHTTTMPRRRCLGSLRTPQALQAGS